MGSFGERLRREREMRGIGLEEIATATKISARNLRALEEEKFNQLPGGIFNKGFVRAYAKFLGIDEEQIVAEYEAASQDTESAREQKLKEEFSKAEFRKQKKDDQEISLEPKSQWGTIAAIVLIAALAYGGYNYYHRRKLEKLQQKQVPAVVMPSTSAPPPAAPPVSQPTTGNPENTSSPQTLPPPETQASSKAETTSAAEGPGKSEAAGPPFELKIKVKKASWISIVADGKTLVSSVLEPGTERTFKADQKIEMIIGNSDGVEVSYNGKPVPNLGSGQDVRKMTFTPTGYE